MSIEAMKPIAWLEPEWGEAICPEVGYEVKMTDDHPRDLGWTPLYAHPPHRIGNIGCLGMPVNVPVTPPQREWVGLTEDEAIELLPVGDWEIESTLDFARAIEQALKGKNT